VPDPPATPCAAIERLKPLGPVLLHLDPRHPGVDVPPDLRDLPILRLKVSPRFANPLSLDDDAVRQRLAFPDGPWLCVIPWEAIFAVGPDGRPPTWLWPAHMPGELLATLPDLPEPPTDVEEPPPRPRPHLRLVKG